jgi:hypothetical protein
MLPHAGRSFGLESKTPASEGGPYKTEQGNERAQSGVTVPQG